MRMSKLHNMFGKWKRGFLILIALAVFLILYLLFSSIYETKTTNPQILRLLKEQNIQSRKHQMLSSHEIKIRNRVNDKSTRSGLTPKHSCKFWAVLRTLSEPSEAVRRFLYLDKWCVVIVGDKKTPKKYGIRTSLLRNFVFLDAEEQLKIQSPFTKSLPWNSYSRKNIGYLYAISQGATAIWDFDDNSMFKFWIDGAAVDINLWMESFISDITGKKMLKTSKVTTNKSDLLFNPHPYLGSPILNSYPRGFPPEHINHSWYQRFSFRNGMVDSTNVAVLQSLADHEPDVDSLFKRVTNKPFHFDKKLATVHQSIILPHGVYSPMNAQATLHFQKSFFALYLPHTVNEAISDIFRSYIAQTLFSLCDLYVGFFPRPLVDRDRRSDLDSVTNLKQVKIPLSTQITSLVEFLDDWRKTKIKLKNYSIHSMAGLMEELYTQLYEKGFVGESEVVSVKSWLEVAIGNSSSRIAQSKYLDVGRPVLYQPQGVPKQCSHADAKKQLIFWTSDLHNGPRVGIPSLFSSLGHKTYVAGVKREHTFYPQVFRDPLNEFYYKNLSPEIMRFRKGMNTPLNDSNLARNMAYYKTNPIIKTVNAFVCSYPASMCELWMPFNMTNSIIILAAHRYNLGRCTVEGWRKLDKELKMLDEQNRLQPSRGPYHVIAMHSRYDLEYIKYYTGLRNVHLLPHFTGYLDGHPYNVTRPEVLVMWRLKYNPSPVDFLTGIKSFKPVRISAYADRKTTYTIDYLTSHKAIIYYPYSIMCFKFSEYYSLNVPLFVPSAKFLRLHGGIGWDRTHWSFCLTRHNAAKIMEKDNSSAHAFNPDINFKEGPEHEMYWLQFSDFYDWPHVQYFDNTTDLEWKITNSDLMSIHKNMKKENEIREYDLLEKWCKIIQKINRKR